MVNNHERTIVLVRPTSPTSIHGILGGTGSGKKIAHEIAIRIPEKGNVTVSSSPKDRARETATNIFLQLPSRLPYEIFQTAPHDVLSAINPHEVKQIHTLIHTNEEWQKPILILVAQLPVCLSLAEYLSKEFFNARCEIDHFPSGGAIVLRYGSCERIMPN